MSYELVIEEGQNTGHRYAIAGRGELTIGRSNECTIIVDDDGVSRHHCRLVSESERLTVIDLGTLNSTFVNGVRVDRGELADGDRLTIGKTTFVWTRLPSPAEADATRTSSDGPSTLVLRRVSATPAKPLG